MSEHNVPAERGRDELRERATKLAQGYLNYPQSVMLRDAIVALFDDLLAQREAPTAGDIDSLDAAMKALHDQLYAEGREGDALIVERAAYAIEALEVDRVLRAAPQEAREPDGWAVRMRDGSCSTIYADRATAERKAAKAREFFAARGDEDDEFDSIDVLPVYLGARAPAEGRQVLALDAIRDVLGIDYDEDSAMWYLPAEPAPIECATLDDALRAYAKMAAPASGEPSGAEAVVREAYEVIDELAPQWSGSSIATVLRAFITVVDDMAQRVQRIDSGPWRRPWNSASAIIAPTAPGAPEEGAGA